MTDFYKLVETPFDRTVDRAIEEANQRYLNDPELQELSQRQALAFYWGLVLRHVFGLGAQMDAELDRLLGKFDKERES